MTLKKKDPRNAIKRANKSDQFDSVAVFGGVETRSEARGQHVFDAVLLECFVCHAMR